MNCARELRYYLAYRYKNKKGDHKVSLLFNFYYSSDVFYPSFSPLSVGAEIVPTITIVFSDF